MGRARDHFGPCLFSRAGGEGAPRCKSIEMSKSSSLQQESGGVGEVRLRSKAKSKSKAKA